MYENLIHKMEEDLLVGGFSDGNEAYEDEPNWLINS
jgi:hypothetical protein